MAIRRELHPRLNAQRKKIFNLINKHLKAEGLGEIELKQVSFKERTAKLNCPPGKEPGLVCRGGVCKWECVDAKPS